MKSFRICIIAIAVAAPAAHAQLNLFGAIQSAQSAISQAKSPDKPDIPSPAALAQQAKGLAAQQMWAQKSAQAGQDHNEQMAERRAQYDAFSQQQQAEADAGQAEGDKRVREAEEYHEKAQQADAQRAAQAAAQARAACPDFADEKATVAERFIRCRNKGMTEAQEMATINTTPIGLQPYFAAMIQDVYEDNITDPRKGKAIQDYYAACANRGTPCGRPAW